MRRPWKAIGLLAIVACTGCARDDANLDGPAEDGVSGGRSQDRSPVGTGDGKPGEESPAPSTGGGGSMPSAPSPAVEMDDDVEASDAGSPSEPPDTTTGASTMIPGLGGGSGTGIPGFDLDAAIPGFDIPGFDGDGGLPFP
jgi:hypothetical protein